MVLVIQAKVDILTITSLVTLKHLTFYNHFIVFLLNQQMNVLFSLVSMNSFKNHFSSSPV